ncbi:DUF3857 domain-containing protein, partial [Dysgonomonas sp. OttesenSCG-928-D17]|nr:DUF3857 domain-containing protein [Dysgonomonas sp. OttesenSCG-928-D17]
MKTYFKLLLCIISILLVQNVFADDYDEYAKKVREEVWAWDRPEFKNYNVPVEFKNESAVILAMHNQLLATGKSRFRIKVTLAMKINKELLYTNTFRKMVKINDKAALDKFSEISYKEEAEASGSMITSKFKTIVGVRIIKPDGIIKEVNVDEAVSVTEGKKDKEDHKKLAISDLQVGDILDYFVQREGHADTENIPPIDFVFANEYPMMSYSVHCEIGNKLTTEYRCVNGAPDFTVSTNDNEDIVLDVQKKDISKMEGMERWTSPYREFPMIRMAVLNNRSKEIWKPKSARKNGLHKDVPSATIFEDAGSQILDNYIGFYMGMKEASKKIADQTKNYKKENPSHTKEELAEFVYDAVQYNLFKEAPYYLTPSNFVNTVNYYLKQNKIDYKAGMVTSKYSARKNEVVNMDDITYLTVVNDNKQIFTFDPIFTIAGEVDYS